jgi:hypothetical protein
VMPHQDSRSLIKHEEEVKTHTSWSTTDQVFPGTSLKLARKMSTKTFSNSERVFVLL